MPLLDQFGRPVEKSLLRQEIAGPTISGVRSILSEHPAQGLTPGRLGVLLREAETGDAESYLELAEEIEEKQLHYLAVLGTRKRQVAQLNIQVEPADDGAEAARDADLVKDWLDAEPIQDELVEILDAVGKGFSVTEIVWDMSERQWMPARLEYRDPRWFEFDDIDGRTLQMRDLQNQREPLAAFKFIQHRFQAKSGLPIRGGFARMVAWWYLFSNYAVKDWVQFMETYGQPTRVGKYPASASEPDKAVLLRALTNLGADAAAMIPESMLIELVTISQGQGGTTTVHKDFLGYCDALISKAVLGQTLTTEVGDSGSRALGDVHDEVRRDIERSDAFALGQTLTRDLAVPMVILNHGERKRYPRIAIGREETLDIARVSDALAKLVPIGLRVPEAWARELVGAPAPEDGEDLLQASMPDPDPDDEGGSGTGNDPENEPEDTDPDDDDTADARVLRAMARRLRARANAADTMDDDIDAAIDLALDDGWRPLITPAIEPILDAVRAAGGYDDLRRQIEDGSLFEGMDTDGLAALLARLSFSAEASGAG
ncbi:MAG: DUF935 domain-containing protein [Acidobacteria bacterium]|nr:DUF935 domain-containing protein [Acidobacteriota bacterium]